MNSVKSNSSAVLGGAFAAFTPGCPACTAPLAVILGAVGGIVIVSNAGIRAEIHFSRSSNIFYLLDYKRTAKP